MSHISEKAEIGLLYHDLLNYGAFNGKGEHQVEVALYDLAWKRPPITAEFLVKCHPAPGWEIEITHLGPCAISSGPFMKIVSSDFVIPQGYTFETIRNVLFAVRSEVLHVAGLAMAEAGKSQ